jgi:hypothetical protein
MTVNNELKRVWKTMVGAKVKVLYRQVFRESEKTTKIPLRTFGFPAGICEEHLSNICKKVAA